MKSTCSILALLAALTWPAPLFAAVPVSSAALLQPFVDRHELAGAVAGGKAQGVFKSWALERFGK